VSRRKSIKMFFAGMWPDVPQATRIRMVSFGAEIPLRTVEGWFCGGHRPSAVYRERLERAYPGLKNAT